MEIEMEKILNSSMNNFCMLIKQFLLPNLYELIFNGILSFLLKQYLCVFFLSLMDNEVMVVYKTKIEKDKKDVYLFFK